MPDPTALRENWVVIKVSGEVDCIPWIKSLAPKVITECFLHFRRTYPDMEMESTLKIGLYDYETYLHPNSDDEDDTIANSVLGQVLLEYFLDLGYTIVDIQTHIDEDTRLDTIIYKLKLTTVN
jgi:hypothetical protein